MVADSTTQLDTITVALLERVDWRNFEHALSPTNDSERLLFRNLFHNMIQLDCQGTVRPGLADAWTADAGGSWTFTLRDSTSFTPGERLTADVVAASLDSAVVLDARHVRVPMQGRDSIPRFLADPALAVMPGMASMGKPGGITLPARKGAPVVDFRFEPNGDARDALDREVDLVVTRDPALVDYVSNRTEFVTFPLPWSRTYVLMETGDRQGELAGDLHTPSVRSSLAKDAVRAGARAAEPPYWWSGLEACPAASAPYSGNPSSSRVVYRTDDEAARDLAERIVALAPTGLRAAGLDPAEFAAAVRGGSERASVIALPRQSLAVCRDASIWPAGARLLPLIDTRAYAIVRRGVPPLSVEWDGTIRVAEP